MKHRVCRGIGNAQDLYAALACMQMTTFRIWMTEAPDPLEWSYLAIALGALTRLNHNIRLLRHYSGPFEASDWGCRPCMVDVCAYVGHVKQK